jgi:hypothetical protein
MDQGAAKAAPSQKVDLEAFSSLWATASLGKAGRTVGEVLTRSLQVYWGFPHRRIPNGQW